MTQDVYDGVDELNSGVTESHMLTSRTLPPVPTFGPHEWLTRIIMPSYSSWMSVARKQPAAIKLCLMMAAVVWKWVRA